MCVYIIVHNCRTQHSTAQNSSDNDNFPLILQTIVIAQMISTGGEGEYNIKM